MPMTEIFLDYLSKNAKVEISELMELAPLLKSKTIKKGDFLLQKGEICGNTFFVIDGLLRMYAIDNKGKEHILQFAPENWFVNDRSSVFFNEPSNYFIDAITDSKVIFIDKYFMQKASEISSELANYNELILQKHILQIQKRIELLLAANTDERYLDFLKTYPNLSQRVPQWMIASYLGITPEGLSRVRKAIVSKK